MSRVKNYALSEDCEMIAKRLETDQKDSLSMGIRTAVS